MKSIFRNLVLAIFLLSATGCGSIHWGDYFNAGGGPPDSTTNSPASTKEPPPQPTLDEQGRRTFR